jgi:hypothetical protein
LTGGKPQRKKVSFENQYDGGATQRNIELSTTLLHRGADTSQQEKVRTSVEDPDPGSGAFFTPGSGKRNGKKPNPGSGMNISESLETIIGLNT